MAQVSIGQVENLSRAITAIEICVHETETEAALSLAEVEQKLNETEDFLNESMQLVQQRESELATAEALLVAAQIALAAAQAALNNAAALAAAEVALAAAERNREKAIRNLDLARQRVEIAQRNYYKARNLHERVRLECLARLKTINAISEEGKSRLKHAWETLDAYLNANSVAKTVYGYLNWRPPANKPVTPQNIHSRISLNPPQQNILIQYLVETDPAFQNKITDYRNTLKAARGQAERDAVYAEISKNLGGEYAEKMTALALQPLGDDVQVQIAYTIKDEKKTFIDFIISNLKVPVVLEEGEEAVAPKGGSIAIEIKTGRKKLLNSREEYMEYRAKADPDASIVLCIRDIKDLSPDETAELRAALKAADSPILAILPDKDLIDEALWKIIVGGDENAES
ncbi:MAG: hypothetical protein LBQ89_02230 [Treponema sp.]|jgi:hypothetical protein|nr:hypothetical protein [Treponema sp.]